MRTVAIIQARMGSTRLPRKVLADICGKPMLWRVWQRVSQCPMLNGVVIATLESDYQEIGGALVAHGGSIEAYSRPGIQDEDVLSRFYTAALHFRADRIVRITGDCPLIDPWLISYMLVDSVGGGYWTNRGDAPEHGYVGFPDGLDVEVFPFDLLERAHRSAVGEEREHVTPKIRELGARKNLGISEADKPLHDKWSVDTEEDLAFVCWVYEKMGRDIFGWHEVSDLLKRDNSWRKLRHLAVV